ncbi:PREDICTED: coiled-coil domain-containing protein 148 [Lepidothrix coronata]|uniref:Coiled-coil domain-containing protein 148 n=1 Tax=Lepidothrix coronata TaxID=321398 RepID=A0A6J0HXR6_9PASS|nr:PREDICTED: coiled-coil domain-containing protein 148 [Lepidothrix coronata]XP_017679251.1 PREDICTED: coiled-coil domain-containing protein 148 [Lepidothrix coronata]XP_017679252.1 PREDICTED: coiled-coil domain-containing protein 148 [Lepidothrix coronata]XP_017679253.1 PREDICTED: coiled-coil domain-containing protein 148 [Lepidothrix coronata]XP_017679255.1 PREDICTED: coiled-coil domain-containing protein 148 [Lepidothrix coronata]XP_017679256.1 PREDICTED: coiled-coil domain-containing prot
MAELDHGTLFSTPRISDGENPVIPARKALCGQKYKPVDYKHLHELAAEAKMASEKTQLKIKKTEQVSKINKEQTLLKQHQQVWWQEHKRLSESRQKAEGEIKTFLNEESHKHNFFLDLRDLEWELSRQRDTYQTNSVVPVWQLKEDLKLKLAEMQRSLSEESCQKPEIDSFEILQQIRFVKNQQKAVLEGLVLESLALERELEDYKANALVGSFEEKNGLFHEVPAELLSLECPYPDLKTLVIQEYQELASGYWARLQEVDQQLEALSRNSDWKEEDQWVFQAVINQYPSDLQRRRTLYLDMLQRYLPHKSWHELVAHEKAWDHCHSIRNQRRALLLSWAQARKAFVLRAVATAAEAAAAHEAEVVLADSRQKQLEICAELKAKVLQWKAQQEEAAKLEAAVAARRKEKEDEKKRLQREQETSRRAQEKEKLKKYWTEKQLKWQEQEERDLQRLEELRKLMAEQAAKDRERVQFRRVLLEKRLLERKEQVLLQAREEEEREKRLEMLRQQVAVVAKSDPARAVADTVASRARMGIGANEEFELQQPLFRLHTYSEEQVISDPRLRVELALREAGLHKTLYAREILPKIPPPKLPRRDMESTAFEV